MSNLIQKLQYANEERSVLIVDDELELATSLSRILKMFFKECVLAKDGEEALELYTERLKSAKPFTLVLTDLELPKKGGLSLIRDIRTLDKSQAILILSAHDEAQFMAEAISLDVQGYLLKPLSMPKLLENLEKVLFQLDIKIEPKERCDFVTGWKTLKQLESFLSTCKNENIALLHVKVNYLSNMYQLIGEEYADEYVKELSILLENLHVNAKSVFYRIAQDEFVLILEDKKLQYVNVLAMDMVSMVKYFHISKNGIIMNSTLSIGIAHGNDNLLKYAKLALEASYSNAMSCVLSYDKTDYENILDITNGREVMKMIYNAIENDSIVPCVQPMLNIKTQKKEIYNSYVRILKDGTIYGPDTFLSVAQNAHQMSMITRSMIKSTLSLYEKLNQKNAILIIHLSLEDFFDESLFPYILFWTQKYNMNSSQIGFEIQFTQSKLDIEKGFSLIKELKQKGYIIILNRFGLDNSNLFSILDLKPHYIKIHTALMSRLEEEPRSIDTIQKLIDIIHFIGSKAIATQIATPKQLELIKTTTIDYIQGYEVCAPYEVK